MANHNEDRLFAQRLNHLMETREMTVREAAQAAGVAVSSLQNWRSGHRPSNFKAIKRLAEALGTSLEFLLIGEGEGAPSPTASSPLTKDRMIVRGEVTTGQDTFEGVVEVRVRRLPKKS